MCVKLIRKSVVPAWGADGLALATWSGFDVQVLVVDTSFFARFLLRLYRQRYVRHIRLDSAGCTGIASSSLLLESMSATGHGAPS
jgi:hypothetical protein